MGTNYDQVLTWASYQPNFWNATGNETQTYTAILDLPTMTVTEAIITQTDHDMFCPGAMTPLSLS